jgi:16S rRNA C1402 N4-methylase RsmH
VLGIDRDPTPLPAARRWWSALAEAALVGRILAHEYTQATDGVVLTRACHPQFDQPARGFSFREDGPWTCA